jgi:phage shock protein A
MKANINALIDKFEDPAKMINQYLIDLKESLAEVKRETAGVLAIAKRCAREYDENEQGIRKYQELAKKAVGAGNDDDARTFIKKYKELEGERPGLAANRDTAAENASRMRAMHDKLVEDIRTLEYRKAHIRSTVAIAKTTQKLNKIGSPTDSASAIGSKFNDMEEKANRMLDEAQAHSELNAPVESAAERLSKKYAEVEDTEVERELLLLKGE